MHDHPHEHPTHQQRQTPTTSATDSAARYPAGPSKGRPQGDASAPGVAETVGHQGVPEQETPADAGGGSLPRAADEAALHRVARRRTREPVQRCERVDVRYSVEEKADILSMARSLNVAAAHYVGAVVMAHVHGDLALPGQRNVVDDYIDELNALRAQVARLGNNVNQIAHRLNAGGHPQPVETAVLERAEHALATVRATLADIDTASHHAATGGAAA